MCGLEKLEIVDQKWLERLSDLLLRTLVVGRRQQSESMEAALFDIRASYASYSFVVVKAVLNVPSF